MAVQVPVREVVEALRGRHTPVGRYAIPIGLASLFAWMAVTVYIEGRSLLPILPMIVIAIFAVSETFAIYEVSLVAIEKRLPIRGTVWKVAVSDIRSITLSWHGRWRLLIEPAAGKTREVPLTGSLHAAVAKMFPQIEERRRFTLSR